MTMSHDSHKAEHADRSTGGPGSSQQNAAKPKEADHSGPAPGTPTNDTRSHRGGELDRHHSHDPASNSTSHKA